LVEECLAVGERRGSKEREEARLFYGCGTSLPDSIVHADAGAAFSALIYSGQLSILISNMCPVFIFFSPIRFGLMLRFGWVSIQFWPGGALNTPANSNGLSGLCFSSYHSCFLRLFSDALLSLGIQVLGNAAKLI
jgi:hypothetical protein